MHPNAGNQIISRPSILKPVQPPKRDNSNDVVSAAGYFSNQDSQDPNSSGIRLTNVAHGIRKVSPAYASVGYNPQQHMQ